MEARGTRDIKKFKSIYLLDDKNIDHGVRRGGRSVSRGFETYYLET